MARRKKEVSQGVAIYARFSTDRQSESSLDDQIRRVTQRVALAGKVVVKSYQDSAISGSHTDRAGLIAMLADATSGQFSEVWVDDLSRLSREMGATWKLVFEDFAALGIKTFDCSTGISSTDQGARLTYGFKALMNDQYIEMVKYQTHRGLEGRALAGAWTGGKVYGYKTVSEPHPADPRSPRMFPAFEEAEVEVLRAIAERFLDGQSTRAIADWLNQTGVPAPHDGGKGNKNARGWGHTTVRSMLLNARYAGEWVWNTAKWEKVPGKSTRRRIPRPESEWVRNTFPALAIFDPDTWARICARFRPKQAGSTQRGPYVKNTSCLAGLLRCGVCGASMTVAGRRTVGTKGYMTLACGTFRSRGKSICPNSRTISDQKVLEALGETLGAFIRSPRAAEELMKALSARFVELESTQEDLKDLEAKLLDANKRMENLLEMASVMGSAGPFREKVALEEASRGRLEAQVADLKKARPTALPHPQIVRGHLAQLVRLLDESPLVARAGLQDLFGSFTMVPYSDHTGGGYVLEGAFDIRVMIPSTQYVKRSQENSEKNISEKVTRAPAVTVGSPTPCMGPCVTGSTPGDSTIALPPAPAAGADTGLREVTPLDADATARQGCDVTSPMLFKSSGGGLHLKSGRWSVGLRVACATWGSIDAHAVAAQDVHSASGT